MPILTLVTPNKTPEFDMWIKNAYPDIAIEDRVVLCDCNAVQWMIKKSLSKDILDAIRAKFRVDVIQQDEPNDIKLFMADMDATIVVGETLDDMASRAGVGGKISIITERAMRGELDFETALIERVGLLNEISADIIDETLHEMELNPGANVLLSHLKSRGVYCVLISGGFTQFTSKIAERLGFDAHFGNELIIQNGVLSGDVTRPILDKAFKRTKMDELKISMQLQASQIMAVGDGANDLPMLQGAGLGIGYYPKPLLKTTLVNTIEYTDLSTLRYMTDGL